MTFSRAMLPTIRASVALLTIVASLPAAAFARMQRMPNMSQAGVYSATLRYLQAVRTAGTTDAAPVMKAMRPSTTPSSPAATSAPTV